VLVELVLYLLLVQVMAPILFFHLSHLLVEEEQVHILPAHKAHNPEVRVVVVLMDLAAPQELQDKEMLVETEILHLHILVEAAVVLVERDRHMVQIMVAMVEMEPHLQ